MKKQIVIIGGGFAGINLARQLTNTEGIHVTLECAREAAGVGQCEPAREKRTGAGPVHSDRVSQGVDAVAAGETARGSSTIWKSSRDAG